ncbi:hypothetical protein AO1008_00431 [Aspergillus oryzae 100-8]|uniref:Cytochrome P450 n=1 Tax=Aspergillus oryzae (strain 3.042) TaxID=1160506 RepID=I8ACY9_ASPO3|nr:hypothetical protein Ao3042_11278 [Aspergillus oryzae 3.042]KDE85072.1 hypothetical protein AO1008_00431 [Aspergillus oryzae 100-8]|eukprot:EIT83392.1 hypothetical protein Ao3042_11278 [Aspergillus oryzae 3.042]
MASPMKSDFLAGSHMKLPKIGIAAAVAVVASIVIYLALSNFFEFKNDESQSIKEYPDNTRFMRFTHGKQLSKAGEDLAGSEPYLIHNGKLKELVIFAPEHLQEFHRKDANSHYKPENMNMGDYAGQLLGQCVGQLGGTKWKLARSHMDPEFSYRASRSMMKRFSQEIDSWKEHPERCVCAGCEEAVQGSVPEVHRDQHLWRDVHTMNELHEKIIFVAFLNKRVMSKWYNKLPTAEKRLMDSFQTQWKAFNLAQIKLAREVPSSQCYIQEYLISL